MNKKITNTEINKVNLYFLVSILSTVLSIFMGFFITKLTIQLYGETLNGIIRFISTIFNYALIGITTINLVFSIQIVKYYKNKDWSTIFWLYKHMKNIYRYSSYVLLVTLLVFAIIIGFLLRTYQINFIFIFMLFLAIAFPTIITVHFQAKYDVFFWGINRPYIMVTITLILKSLFFLYAVMVMVIDPPTLHSIPSTENNHHKIITFINGDWRVWNIVIAIFLYSASSIIISPIAYKIFKNKYHYKMQKQYPIIPSQKKQKKIKAEIWKSLKFSLLLAIASLAVNSTDEFVFLIAKTTTNENSILKTIGIYGLYVSLSSAFFNIFQQYIKSRQVLIGLNDTSLKNVNIYMNNLQKNSFVYSGIFLLTTVIVSPILVNILFNPNLGNIAIANQYYDINFAIPLTLLLFFRLLYFPDYLLMEIKNNFKVLSFLSILEGIINLILSITLMYIYKNVYLVIWSSVIAVCIKICIIKIYVHHLLQRSIYKTKPNINTLILLISIPLLFIGESILLYTINWFEIIMNNFSIIIICIYIFIAVLSSWFYLYYRNKPPLNK